jgi:hypothetical protein
MVGESDTLEVKGVASLPSLRVGDQKLYHGSVIPRQEYIHPPIRDRSFGNGSYFTDNVDVARLYATHRNTFSWSDFKEKKESALKGGAETPTLYEVSVSGVFLDLRSNDKPLLDFLAANSNAVLSLFDKLAAESEAGQNTGLYTKRGSLKMRRAEISWTLGLLRGESVNSFESTSRKGREERVYICLSDIMPIFLSKCGFTGRIDRALEGFIGSNGVLDPKSLTQWVVFNPEDAKVVKETPVENTPYTN